MKNAYTKLGLLFAAVMGGSALAQTPTMHLVAPNHAVQNTATTIRILGSSMQGSTSTQVCYVPAAAASACPVVLTPSVLTNTEIVASVPGQATIGFGQIKVITDGSFTTTLPFYILTGTTGQISNLNPTSRVVGSGTNPISATVTSNPVAYGASSLQVIRPGNSPVSMGTFTGQPTTLNGSLPASQLFFTGTIYVFANFDGGVGAPGPTLNSGVLSFTVSPMTLTSISPTSALVGSGPITLTATGNFPQLSTSNDQGFPYIEFTKPGGSFSNSYFPVSGSPTATQVVVTIPATELDVIGTAVAQVSQMTLGEGGYTTTSTQNFLIVPLAPTLTGATPTPAPQNTATTFTLTGTNLVPLTSVTFTPPGGTAVTLTPSSASATSITVTVPAGNMTPTGTGTFRVVTTGGNAQTTITIADPTLTSVSPNSALQNAASTNITLTGTNFQMAGNSVVAQFRPPGSATYNDLATVISASTFATIPNTLLTTAGNGFVRVRVGNAVSADQPFTVIAPVLNTPTSPASANVAAANFTITMSGTNLNAGGTPTVRFTPPGGNATTLGLVGTPTATQVQATVTTGLLANAGNASIQLQTGTALSNTITFPISSVPSITSMFPSEAFTGDGNTTLSLFGSNFPANPIVRFTPAVGAPTNLTIVGTPTSSSIDALIPSSLLTTVQTATILVTSASGPNSNTRNFTIFPTPVVSSLSPSAATAGGAQFTLTVTGANFDNSAGYTPYIRFNTTLLFSTIQLSATQASVLVPANLIASPGSYPVTVEMLPPSFGQTNSRGRAAAAGRNLPQVGPVSNVLNFNVFATPAISSLSPLRTPAGTGVTLTINGTGFRTGDTVDFNGTSLTPSAISATVITVTVPANLVSTAGFRNVRVVSNLNANSNTAQFAVDYVITQLSPSFTNQGSASFPLTVTATAPMSDNTRISFNGTLLQTTNFAGNSITGTVPANLVTSVGVVPVSLNDGNALFSNSLNFSILGPVNISSISPGFSQTLDQNGPPLVLTISGSGFDSGSTVNFGGADRQTTFISATQLTATIPAVAVTTGGNRDVYVRDSRGRLSNTVSYPILGPISIQNLVPSSREAGSSTFTMTINGSGFEAVDTVAFQGTNLATTYVNPNQLTAVVPASLLVTPGGYNVTVSDNRGRTSAPSTFTVVPAGNLLSLSPTFVEVGASTFTLTLNGVNFAQGTTLQFGSTTLSTTFVSANQLTAQIPANLVAAPAAISVSLTSPQGAPTNTLPFAVLAPIRITNLSPNNRDAGTAAFTLTINGSGFEQGNTVSFGGSNLAATFVSATQLTVQIAASLITNPGSVSVTVSDARGRTSPPANFVINSPGNLQSLSPSSVEVNSAAFTLTLNGQNFVQESTVNFGSLQIPANFISSTQLTVPIPANQLTQVAQIPVFVRAPSGAASNTLNFNVVNTLRLNNIAPTSANAGTPGFTMTANGVGFQSGAVIRFGAANLVTTFVNANTLTGVVPASLLAAEGNVEVRVQNPDARVVGPLAFAILPALRITSVSPNSFQVNATTTTIGITGQGFVAESIARVGGLNLQTTFLNSTQLTAIVPTSLLAATGDLDVVVVNPLNATSNRLIVTVGNSSSFSLTGVNPTGAPLNGPAQSITLTGAGFTNQAVARFNGIDIPTAFVNQTQLTAVIPAELLRTAGNFPITVAIGTQVSSAVTFQVGNRPEITFLNPAAITAGARQFTLITLGRGFVNGSVIKFGDATLLTTFQGGAQLAGVVPAELVAKAGTFAVTVSNPDGQTSNSVDFRVVDLTLTSLNPERIAAGSAGFTLSLSGTGFINGATVSFGSTGAATAFVSQSSLTAQIPASAVQAAGELNVTVTNPDGARSNALKFIIDSDIPSITRINPSSALVGSDDVSISIIGGGFVRGSSVSANGNGLASSFGSPTSMEATIPASLLQTLGTLRIKVTNPGNKESNEVGFNVVAPTPVITNVNPTTFNAGSAADVSIAVTGSNFLNGAVVEFNGNGLQTSFGNSTSLTAIVPASLLTTPGNVSFVVVNPGEVRSSAAQGQILTPLTVTNVNPNVLVGSNANVIITVTGTGFVNGATVQLGSTSLATTFVSATQLTAIVPAGVQGSAATLGVSVRNPNSSVSNSVNLRIEAPLVNTSINLQVPATITAAGNGQVAVTLTAPAPLALSGTLELTFAANASNLPAGYIDPALVFLGTNTRQVTFTIAQGATNAVIGGGGAFSPGSVSGVITVTVIALRGNNNQDLLPSPAPSRTITIDRAAPTVVSGSVRITTIAGGIQVEFNGVSPTREVTRIAFTFSATGASILDGQTITVDVGPAFNTYFASDAGRAAGGAFRFTQPFTISGGDAAAITQVSVTVTNSVGTSPAVTGGR